MNAADPHKLSPFSRLDVEDFTPKSALVHYRTYGFLWIRLGRNGVKRKRNDFLSLFRQELNANPEAFTKNWSVENLGDHGSEDENTPQRIIGGSNDDNNINASDDARKLIEKNKFYVSTIIHRNQKETLDQILEHALSFDKLGIPELLADCRHNGGAWLFLGRNPVEGETPKKEGMRQQKSLAGRAEHVDEVSHSGTWHMQLSGSKTWLVRPNIKADDWNSHSTTDNGNDVEFDDTVGVSPPPDLSLVKGAERSKGGGRAWRLRVKVTREDLFIINTRAWYHRTELEPSEEWSISLARDFYLPIVTEELCPGDFKKGEILLDEDDIPDSLPKDPEGNCALAEVVEDDDESDDEDDQETRIVLVALRDIREGEPLVLSTDMQQDDEEGGEVDDADDDNEEGSGVEEEYNACEGVDPRAIATQDWGQGETLLSGNDIPDDLPRSLQPSCELVIDETEDNEVFLRSLHVIKCGDILTLVPEDDGDYEEVEVDLSTGEMARISRHS